MKRVVLLTLLFGIVLATVAAQSAAAAAPTITAFSPASGPAKWPVVITGTGFTGATGVSFNTTDPHLGSIAATFTVQDDSTTVATVPYTTTRPFAATLTVVTPDGQATSASTFQVDGMILLGEHRGSRGESLTLKGSGFAGATKVEFGTWREPANVGDAFALIEPAKARFRIVSDAKIVATVPVLATERRYWITVVTPKAESVSSYSTPFFVVTPRLLKDTSSHFAIRPAYVAPSEDNSFAIGHIRWRLWNSARATGLGTVWIDNGIPNMAQGTYHHYRCSVTATRVRVGRYTRLTLRWRAGGHNKAETLKLTHAFIGSGWFWN